MDIDLAGRRDAVPERYIPELMRGELLEAEHIARYGWIAPLAAGRRVLDAGCGMGDGGAIMARAGARCVVGVDIAEAVLDAARPGMPDGVLLEAGDLRSLGADDDSFDLVACMETIDHFADPDVVLDEFARVLAPDGLLAISSSRRSLSVGLHPHHLHEYTPAELQRALDGRFRHVRLVGQRTFTGSTVGVLDDPDDLVGIDDTHFFRLSHDHESAPFVLAIASNAELPPLSGVVALGPAVSWEKWTQSWAAQQQEIHLQTRRAETAEQRLEDCAELQRRLVEAEQLLAEMPERERELSDAIAQRDYALEWARMRVAQLENTWRESTARRLARAFRQRVGGRDA